MGIVVVIPELGTTIVQQYHLTPPLIWLISSTLRLRRVSTRRESFLPFFFIADPPSLSPRRARIGTLRFSCCCTGRSWALSEECDVGGKTPSPGFQKQGSLALLCGSAREPGTRDRPDQVRRA